MSDIIYVEQEPLYIANHTTTISYTDEEPGGGSYNLYVYGGSGTGNLHYEVENGSGSGTIDTNGVFNFITHGSVYVKVYKEGSPCTQWPDGTTIDGYYMQSKTLVVQLNLTQTEVEIEAVPDMVYNIGTPKPSEPDQTYQVFVPGVPPGPVLAQVPTIYFVNDSEDYYKPDFLHEIPLQSRIVGGVNYVLNPDGSWTVEGVAGDTESCLYMYSSILSLPYFFKPGQTYTIVHEGIQEVMLRIEWYRNGEWMIEDESLSSSYQITVPEVANGIQISMIVAPHVAVDGVVNYHIYNTHERSIVDDKEGRYPISARNAEVYNNEYVPTIKYKSAWLIYENTQKYRVFISISGFGTIDFDYTYTTPYTMVQVTINAKVDGFYDDGWDGVDGHYIPTASSNQTYYDDWWIDVTNYQGITIDNSVTKGGPDNEYDASTNPNPHGFYMTDENNRRIPFHAMERISDSQGRLIHGKYIFIMPISNVRVYMSFGCISISEDDQIYYGRYPYTDVGFGNAFSSGVKLRDKSYADALVFCYYARQFYFNDLHTPLMQGVATAQFYGTYSGGQYSDSTTPAWGEREHYITRRDAIEVVRRISHVLDFAQEDSWSLQAIAADPDGYEYAKGVATNLPLQHLYTYAGYPPEEGHSIGDTQTPAFTDSRGVITGRTISKFFSPQADLYVYSGTKANDDYLVNARYLHTIAWNTWIGTTVGYEDNSFGPSSFLTYQQAITILWRYARFRQFDVTTHGSDVELTPQQQEEWPQNSPIRWAISKQIITGYRAPLVDALNNLDIPFDTPVSPTDLVDRVEWAHMVYNFCRRYAW